MKDFVLEPQDFWREYYNLIDKAVESLEASAKRIKNSDLTYSLYYGDLWVEFYPRCGTDGKKILSRRA